MEKKKEKKVIHRGESEDESENVKKWGSFEGYL